MSDFPINIKVDPGDSKTKIDDVHRTVERAEKQATAATRAFSTLGDAIKYTANTTISQTVRGFGSLNDALQLEHRWLTMIRGDTQGYAKDLTVLNSLLDRGKISVKEYDAALASAGQKHGLADAKPAAGMLDGIAGQALAIAGPAAIAAKAIGAITAGLEEMRARAQETREVNASMLRYTDSIVEAKLVTEQMREVSHLLGTDLKTTAGVFLDVAGASSSLNLSHEKLVDITKSLGLIMKTEGKSIGEVGGVMQTLEFAIAKGTISSGELARIMKQFRPIAAIWREEFGATEKQLLDAAESGQLAKLGLDRLITSIHTSTEIVDRHKQQWHAQNQTIKTGAGYYTQLNELMELNKLKASDLVDVNRRLIDSWGDVGAGALSVGERFDQLKDKAHKLFGALRQLGADKWGNTKDTRNLLATGLDNIIAKAHEGAFAVEKLAKVQQKSLEQAKAWQAELKKLANAEAKTLTDDLVTKLQNEIDEAEAAAALLRASADIHAAVQMVDISKGIPEKRMREVIDGGAKGFSDLERALQHFAESLRQGAVAQVDKLGDAFADFFIDGKMRFKDFVESALRDLARLAVQQTVVMGFRAAAPGLFGSPLGGSAGLNLKVPHFAGGGGMRIPGTGATDTTPVTFFATGGEDLTVRTPGQQMAASEAAQQSPAPAAPTQVVLTLDDRALLRVLRSPMGATVLDDVIRRNPGLLKKR